MPPSVDDVARAAREAHAAVERLGAVARAHAAEHYRPAVAHLASEATRSLGRIVAASGATRREGA